MTRSLRVWLLVVIPSIAVVLVSVARPTTLSLYASHALAWGMAGVGSALSVGGPWRWRPSALAYAIASVLVLLFVPGLLYGSRVQFQWETLGGPGIDAPGPFRVHRREEVDALLWTPWVAVIAGATAGVLARWRWFAASMKWLALVALFLLGLLAVISVLLAH